MSDQATALRGLMERRLTPVDVRLESTAGRRAFALAVTSGKGGVGKSNIALNVAIELARLDAAVCLFDANPGLGNIELLCGLNGYWNLSHVVTGARTLREITLAGPAGVHVVPGGGLGELADGPPAVRREVLHQLEELEREHDFLVIDAGTGMQRAVRRLLAAADVVLVVTTPEPTAIADAYATIKALSPAASGRMEAVVNQCDSARLAEAIVDRLAQTARLFVRVEVHSAGWIPRDADVPQAVARRTPLALAAPHSRAAQAVRQLARRVKTLAAARPASEPFFEQLTSHPLCRAA
ncbi:MAG TPA: P-loop NTPase [Planctomycetaceae bacterium]|nr:P-loop NTPase [Planctomycetaceae bacterium]